MSQNVEDVDEILKEVSSDEGTQKEEFLEEDYNIKKSVFKSERPKIEQFFDKRKILGVLLIIVVLSVLFVMFSKPPEKKEEKVVGKQNAASTKPFDVNEALSSLETQTGDQNNVEEDTENIPVTATSPDDYDRYVGTQYNDNESFDDTRFSDSVPVEDNKKSYRKSPIDFKKNTLSSSTGTVSGSSGNIPQEQQQLQAQGVINQPVDTDQNRQESKRKFLSSQRSRSFYSANAVTPPLSSYEVKAGTIIEAVLLTSINSDLPGEIIAQTTRDVKDFKTLNHVLIPKGSTVLGRYDSDITYGQNRVLVVWDRITFPNGYTLNLDNYQGVDLAGNAGLKGKVNNHFWKLLRSVVLSAGINMAANRLEDLNVNIEAGSRSRVTVGTGASDAAKNISDIGSRIIEKDLNRQPTLQIRRGSRFGIFVNADMAIPPYKGR